ncbi:2-hydroxymuconate tautomerase family protein [Pseudomonas stutzeri]|uniref:tautomerase family protein n=1 Tax=Stutzerimonas stutzeri TaxID=316 RepID=UPI00210A91AD|nr:2-hydroxymuconate tautomerase family protein [Stutzerimonas stutzeri]MCQ4291004.1 2-hydroxymuconate tautomerase family protein [Stutzerimonas stutzeri]
MPLLQVSIVEGRSPEMKEALIRNLTATVVDTLAVKPEAVRVLIQELPKTHWGTGGQSMAQRDRNPS